MAKSFNDLRNEALSKLGAVPRGNDHDEVSEQVTEREEEQEEVVEEPTEVETDEEEEEEEISDPLSVLYEKEEKPSEESQLDRLRQELAEVRGELRGRLDEAKATARGEEKTKEKFDSSKINWGSPEMVRVFEQMGLDEEDAERLAPQLGKLISTTAKLEAEAAVGGVKETVERNTVEQDRATQQETLQNNIGQGLVRAVRAGGLEAAVAQDFQARGKQSLLYKEIHSNPELSLKPESVWRAIQGIASDARRAGATAPESSGDGEIVGSREEVTAALSRGNTSTLRKTKKKKEELTYEQQVLKRLLDAGPRTDKLPDFLR